MPGRASGKVTRQNVIQALSPRSCEASSRLLSKPSRRDISTSMENGTQTSTWPAPTVHSDERDIENLQDDDQQRDRHDDGRESPAAA